MKIDNLSEVEAWKGSARLQSGVHDVVCVSAEEVTSKTGNNPGLDLTLEAIDGVEKGGSIRDFIYVTPKTLGKVKQMMLGFGVEIPAGAFELDVNDIVGHTTRVIVRPQQDEPKYTEVVAYEPTTATVPTSNGAADPAAKKIPF